MTNLTSNGIVTKSQTQVVDTIPQHSNSDISGSVKSEDLFGGKNQTQNVKNWINWIEENWNEPLNLALIAGLLLSLILFLITLCFIISIWRYIFLLKLKST